jgi:hypothetical protein
MKDEKPFYEVMREIDEVCGSPVGPSPVAIFEEGRKEGIVSERKRLKELFLETFGVKTEYTGKAVQINFTDRQKAFFAELSKEHNHNR